MIQNDSHVIRKETCPECRKLGNDRSGDNLAVYSDGHCYCYRCGYRTGRRSFTQTKDSTRTPTDGTSIVLPSDVTTELPFEAKDWLKQYQLTRLDTNRNHIMWSEKWSRIIFPYFNEVELLAWQGRYIPCGKNQVNVNGKAPAKWFSQGKIHEIIHPVQVTKRKAIVVEDIVSAIKVSRLCGAIPLFGSSVSTKQILRLKTVVDEVWYWLDPDMRTKSVKMVKLSNLLGLPAHVIFSDKDPKEHDEHEIKNILVETNAIL